MFVKATGGVLRGQSFKLRVSSYVVAGCGFTALATRTRVRSVKLGILDQDPLESLNAQVAQLRNDTQDLRSANIRSSSSFTKSVTDLFLSLFHTDSTTTDTTTAKVVTPYCTWNNTEMTSTARTTTMRSGVPA